MKTVAINAMALVRDRPIGIERYARNVIGKLDLGNRLVSCFTRPGVNLDDRLGAGFRKRHPVLKQTVVSAGSTAIRILKEMFVLSWMARKVDTVLSINNFGPLWGKPTQRRIVIIHDVWFMSDVFEGKVVERIIFRILISLQIRRAHEIVTISEFSRREILKHFKIDTNKITIVRNCLSQPLLNVSDDPGGSSAYVLLVGSDRKNKNVLRSVAGFCTYIQNSRRSDTVLNIAGGYSEHFKAQIHNNFDSFRDLIHFTGYVSDEELEQLYCGCTCVLFASLYEGYGLPAIEAVLRGKPVVVSQDTACAEELGALGVVVDGLEPDAIAEGISLAIAVQIDPGSEQFRSFSSRQYDCAAQVQKLNALLS